jgi:hypothetical protein
MKKMTFGVVVAFIVVILVGAWFYISRDKGTYSPADNQQTNNNGNQDNTDNNNNADTHPGLKSFSDAASGVTFWYPEDLSTKYISKVDWPPAVQVMSGPFACTEAGDETKPAGKTEQKTIMGRDYCVTTESEGAAGSVYNQYAYAFSKNDKTVILTFSLRFVQCGNYDKPQADECTAERNGFNPDTVIDQIAQTVSIQ